MIDKNLLTLLVCPITKGPLEYNKDKQVLISRSAKLVYPINDGVPVLLEEQALDLAEFELSLEKSKG